MDEKHFIARTEQGVTHFRKTRFASEREREAQRHRGRPRDLRQLVWHNKVCPAARIARQALNIKM